jgi:hypothetical protein
LAARANVTSDQAAYENLSGVLRDSRVTLGTDEISEWKRNIREIEVGSRGLREYKKFIAAIESCSQQKNFHISGFTWIEVSSWRIFSRIFPESISMFETVVANSERFSPGEIMATSLILSALSAMPDGALSSRAIETLRLLSGQYSIRRAYSFQEFCVSSQLRFSIAEADGAARYVNKCIDFNHAHDPRWHQRLMRIYYEEKTNSTHIRASLRKLSNPKMRDINTESITEYFLEKIGTKNR